MKVHGAERRTPTRQRPSAEHKLAGEISSGLAAPLVPAVDVFDQTVEISPIDAVRRHSTRRYGILLESIYAPAQSKIEFQFRAPFHLLVMYDDGIRRDGETSIDGLAPSKLRNVANKMTFVPANHDYNERHEARTSMRFSYLYLDASKLDVTGDESTIYTPSAFFNDRAVWDTVTRLRGVIESGKANKSYVDALTNVLAHELSRTNEEPSGNLQVSRGGLATWQMRLVTQHIEEHLSEQISLVKLAGLARLSQFHFCRAFRQSFGVPPHEYHIRRRIEKAKALLAEGNASVTGVGFELGYSYTSSFSVAFRKMTGRSPREFRRDFT
jgi:AraC family transcriptional regulator